MLPLPEPADVPPTDDYREVRIDFVWNPVRGVYVLTDYPGWEFEPLFSVPQGEEEVDPDKVVGELKFPDGTKEVATLTEVLATIAVAEELVAERTRIVGWLPEDWPYPSTTDGPI